MRSARRPARRSRRGAWAPRRSSFRSRLPPGGAVRWRATLRVDLLPFLRRYGGRQGWSEMRTAKGTPCFGLPGGGTLTFEPGGQLEYSSPPCRSPSALLALLASVVLPLRAAACGRRHHPAGRGDRSGQPDRSGAAAAPGEALRADGRLPGAPRAGRRPDDAADGIVPGGARPRRRALAALAGAERGGALRRSHVRQLLRLRRRGDRLSQPRALVWRALDPARTGLPYGEHAPVEAYLDFALEAPAMLLPTIEGEHLRFGDWLGRART